MMKWSKSTWTYRDDDEWSSPPRRRSHTRKVRPSSSPPRKRAKGKTKGKGKGKDQQGWWTWVPDKTADAPWRKRDEADSKETIEIPDEDKEDDQKEQDKESCSGTSRDLDPPEEQKGQQLP